MFEVRFYIDAKGKIPLNQWLDRLDPVTRKRILLRLSRVRDGNLGDWKSLGDGLFELRIFFGPGYRIYFAKQEEVIIVFLLGGDKSTQESDIERARLYWEDFLERQKDEE